MGIHVAKWRGDLENSLGYERLEWRKRIVSMAQFLSDEDLTVMDLGAGNMHLRKLLSPSVKYIPVDYKKNDPETVVCDFNKKEFPDITVDAIVAAGILGYIDDPFWFLDRICKITRKLILSYKGKEKYADSLLTTKDVISYLCKKGFCLTGEDKTLDEWTLIGCFQFISPRLLGKQIECTGCGACVNACHNDALSFSYDNEGFLKPSLNESKCSECALCVHVCPIRNNEKDNIKKESPDVYAAWAKDEIREASSSGGVFYMIASHIIDKGGCVFGAVWDDEFNCIIRCTENKSELQEYMHSKYVQSNTEGAFKKVRTKLQQGKRVLYIGTPCQIEGLYSYLGNMAGDELLYTVDLICFGVPSNKVFHRYLEETYHLPNIANIIFRDKSAGEGWSPTGYGIYLKNGTVQYKNGEDSFQKAFHSVLFRNSVCEACTYYNLPRRGDITLGDFWGIGVHDPTWNDQKGTSLVSINSTNGMQLWEDVVQGLSRVQKVDLNWPKDKGNRYGTNARTGHKNKRYFLELLSKYSFERSVKWALEGIHDVGIVCMMNYNIGNNLTNYALYNVVSSLGYEPQMIDMPSDAEESSYYNPKGPVHYFLKSPYKNNAIYKPKDFWDLYEHDNCQIYILGSDQLWRDRFIQSTDYFTTLNWCSPYKKKISYATSMGVSFDDTNLELLADTKKYIKRINKVSVRETFAQNILEQWGIESTVVIDPVFLCEKSCYDELGNRGKMRLPDRKYTFGYFLDPDSRKEKILKDMADEKTDGTYIVTTEPTYQEYKSEIVHYTMEPCVEEWIAMVRDSDYVITDSFHGMCFALIYNKQFWVVFQKDNWRGIDRFSDFLSKLGLESRLIVTDDYISHAEYIDYHSVNKIVEGLKESSLSWLTNAIDERIIPCVDDYDYYLRTQNENRKRILENAEKMRCISSDIFFKSRMCRSIVKHKKEEEKIEMIVGWGAGGCFRKNEKVLNKYCEIKFVCDSNPKLWGSKLSDEITCISPAELLKMNSPFVLIMVENAAAVVKIVNSLMDMGIVNFEHINNWLLELDINDMEE